MARAPITSADQAIAFLMSLVRDDPRPYAARAELDALPVCALLERVDNPHTAFPIVHIAGSKGKGSTALYLEAILEAAGLRTGTFTSPHLERWTERLRVGARESTAARFAALLATLEPHVHALRNEDAARAPSFFDVLTAAAFLHFAEQRVDCAIIETGIGGTLDATNVVSPRVACITSVELEHTDKLGEDIGEIAAHKAGIIKRGVPVVVGRLPREAVSVVRERAAMLDAPVIEPGRAIAFERLVPACMADNAALAVACAQHLVDRRRLERAVSRALPRVRLPGRMEILAEKPWVIVDGAHTRDSIRALADMLSGVPADELHLLVSLSARRDAGTLLAPLIERAHRIVTTRADPLRCVESRLLASDLLRAGCHRSRVRVVDDARAAVLECRAALGRRDLLCVAGSMYLAGLARAVLLDARGAEQAAS